MSNYVYDKQQTAILLQQMGLWDLLKYVLQNKFTVGLILACLLILSPLCYSVLSATTTNVTLGSAPYFTYDGGLTRTLSTDGLLGITLSDGTLIIPSLNAAFPKATVNKSTPQNPIELPELGQTFADVRTNIPLDTPELSDKDPTQMIELNTFVNEPYHYWGDVDGDTDAVATGTLSLAIKDNIGRKVKRSDSLNACYAPYTLTLDASEGVLSTLYGLPKSIEFMASNATYYIKPKTDVPYVCNIMPNLASSGLPLTDGPAEQWDPKRGFKTQDLAKPQHNFPTIGTYGLYFDLRIVNAKGAQIYYSKSPSKSNVSISLVPLPNSDPSVDTLLVNLLGPKEGDTAAQAKFTPTTFTFYADKAKTQVIYRFKLRQWGIVKTVPAASYNEAQPFCDNLGYRIPSIAELTNANGNGWQGGLKGQGNNYQRRISVTSSSRITEANPLGINGGLFSEWGHVNDKYYQISYFMSNYYWANEPLISNESTLYPLVSYDGSISYEKETYPNVGVVCISP